MLIQPRDQHRYLCACSLQRICVTAGLQLLDLPRWRGAAAAVAARGALQDKKRNGQGAVRGGASRACSSARCPSRLIACGCRLLCRRCRSRAHPCALSSSCEICLGAATSPFATLRVRVFACRLMCIQGVTRGAGGVTVCPVRHAVHVGSGMINEHVQVTPRHTSCASAPIDLICCCRHSCPRLSAASARKRCGHSVGAVGGGCVASTAELLRGIGSDLALC